MASRTAKQTYTFRDAKGQIGRIAFWVNYSDAEATPDAWTLGSNMATALAASSNGALIVASGPYAVALPNAYGARADYVDAEDKAVLVMQDTLGVLHRFAVPSPKASMFMADGQTVSPTSATVTNIIAALATPVNAAGFGAKGNGAANFASAPGGFVGGYRQRRNSKRPSIWLLSGGLDEPAQ